MQCEICGADIKGPSSRIGIDGGELTVCSRCSQYGKSAEKRSPVSRKVSPVAPVVPRRSSKPPGKAPEAMKTELVDNYPHIIREAREKKQLSHEELALRIKEKAPLLKKLERGDLVPEEDLRKKLEKELEIKLTERSEEDKWSTDHLSKGTTLGDIVTIKKK